MPKTLIILNPHAGGGRAGQLWRDVEPLLWESLGELIVAVTDRPSDVAEHLDKAQAVGVTRVVSIGGDGTNHALVNALADLNARSPQSEPMVYGNLPIGTGRDWARGQGVPYNDLKAAAAWIAHAQPKATDIGKLAYDEGHEYFLNIASAGIGGEVSERINRLTTRHPWSFLSQTVATLIEHQPRAMEITLDGKPWYDGTAYIVAVANGTTFGHGMKIAPNAQPRDGLFDVVLVEGVSRLTILAALQRVYSGTHLTHPAVRSARAAQVQIRSPQGSLGIELDGEPLRADNLTFSVQPGLLQILA
ncbi:MAG TPA: diacylglycerol kinase family protein [Phototrophicaceae bacterium]|nr:diacylglycerol kinase family protein [Phototrophicaceae bacterium]